MAKEKEINQLTNNFVTRLIGPLSELVLDWMDLITSSCSLPVERYIWQGPGSRRSCRRLCALVIRLAALPRCLSSQFGKLHLTAAQQHQQCPRHSSSGRPAYCQTSHYPLLAVAIWMYHSQSSLVFSILLHPLSFFLSATSHNLLSELYPKTGYLIS